MSQPEPTDLAFKDLCMDATDPAAAAEFWSRALGLQSTPRPTGYLLSDGVDEHALWINRVSEPKTVKLRVHLDVHVRAVDDLTALGATVVDDAHRWTVLVDPLGAELCAFVRPPEKLPSYRLYELGVDCADPERIASWWADRFGVRAEADPGGGFWWIDGAPGLPWEMVFVEVPEPKAGKNRLHWDVWGSTAELTAAGATLLRRRDDEIHWDVLADPEGNEFCVFTRTT